MSEKSYPNDRRYTKDHEWAKPEGDHYLIGISAFAVEQLGDITLVSFDVEEGDTIEKGKTFGTVESVKTLSDIYAPITGKVVGVNEKLDDNPELLNESPYEEAWFIEVEPTASGEFETLMDADRYAQSLDEH